MEGPPSYAESIGKGLGRSTQECQSSEKIQIWQVWDLQDEARASSTELVASAVARARTILERRARLGVSRTTLVLVPHEQNSTALDGRNELVGFLENERPVLVALQSEADSVDFWAQQQVLHEFRAQLGQVMGASSSSQKPVGPALSLRQATRSTGFVPSLPPTATNGSTAGSKEAVKAEMREIYVRTETPFGLFKTVSLMALVVRVVL